MKLHRNLIIMLAVGLSHGLLACGEDDGGGSSPSDALDGNGDAIGDSQDDATIEPSEIAEQLGMARYKNSADPVSSAEASGVTTWEFDVDDGPACLQGDPFRMATRSNDSSDLLIFLQGGGACWSDYCLAVTRAPESIALSGNFLDASKESNPFKDWNVVYLPYCDGSLFVGDKDHDDDDDGEIDRYHRGLANLTASLDVAVEQFPSVDRVVLAGASAGGFGTIMGAPLVRSYYPEADIIVLNDAGVGIAKPGDEAFIEQLIDEFGAEDFVPADCPDCLDNGTIVGLVDWYFAIDPNIQMAAISSWYDTIISRVFLQIEPTAFQAALELETGEVNAKYPDRYKRFIYGGKAHTATLGDVSGIVGTDVSAVILPPNAGDLFGNLDIETIDTAAIGDVLLVDWINSILSGDWEDLTAPVGTPPE